MDPLTWTGPFGGFMDPIFTVVLVIFLILIALQVIGAYTLPAVNDRVLAALAAKRSPVEYADPMA